MRLKHDDSVNRIIVEIDRNSSAQTGLPLCGAGMWLFCRKLRRFRLIFRQKRLSPPNSWHGAGRPIHRGLWTNGVSRVIRRRPESAKVEPGRPKK